MSLTVDYHEADDHAPFAHYLVGNYVVCFFCGHWIARPLKTCKCAASCHAESIASTLVDG